MGTCIFWLDLHKYLNEPFCVRPQMVLPVDVYDAASWMAITLLIEKSIKTGSFVEIPDFTNGAYKTRERYDIK